MAEYTNIFIQDSSHSHSEPDGWWNDPSDPANVLDHCRADTERLWADEAVQAELKKKRVRLEESSGLSVHGFFLLLSMAGIH